MPVLSSQFNRIAIDGGSFDPLHNEHIIRLTGILKSPDFEALQMSQVVVIPSGSGGRKDKTIGTDPHLRLEMAQQMARTVETKTNYKIKVDAIDVFREPNTPTYFLWQELLQKESYRNARLYFILGSDWQPHTIRKQWIEGEKLVDPATGVHFIIAPRQGYPRQFDSQQWPNFHWVEYHPDFQPAELSSTFIRHRVQSGQDISALVPAAVRQLIDTHQLYR